MKAFDRIREGLEQAISHAAGEPVEAVIHRPRIQNVKSIREKTGLTQAQFAARCRVSINTLRHWERQPRGTAMVLLQLVERHSQWVVESQP
jgi:putative transcriptional regulator